jgi:D-serine deaminase-like pyridoxal phosphate-dependent protein
MTPNIPPWFTVANVYEVPSPSLLVYPERVEENVRRMIAIAGGVTRLRPHMKTHKMAEMIRLQLKLGITKFKCATIAEAEMTAANGAADVLLAYQPVGPNVTRMVQLTRQYPKTQFATLVDDEAAARKWSEAFVANGARLTVLLDVDCGQHRCGIEPGPVAIELYRRVAAMPGLSAGGLHAYDGHIHDQDLVVRTANCDAAFAPVEKLKADLIAAGLTVPTMVAGGTPTFPIHAKRGDVECSPGTCVFWDAGYGAKMPDMDFLVAAALLTRVVSKPGGNRLCLDLGHKAVASEMPHPRVVFPQLPDAKAVTHSEEHLVVETSRAGEFAVGDCLYGIPWHICPTVALHAAAVVVRGGHAVERWSVAARARRFTL